MWHKYAVSVRSFTKLQWRQKAELLVPMGLLLDDSMLKAARIATRVGLKTFFLLWVPSGAPLIRMPGKHCDQVSWLIKILVLFLLISTYSSWKYRQNIVSHSANQVGFPFKAGHPTNRCALLCLSLTYTFWPRRCTAFTRQFTHSFQQHFRGWRCTSPCVQRVTEGATQSSELSTGLLVESYCR